MDRLLITGGSSYLGQHLVPLAIPYYETIYTYFSNDPLALPCGIQLDIRDETAVSTAIQHIQPDAIIHTVGSNRSADMVKVIEMGTRQITEAAKKINARLIHLSTDSVFSGTLGQPYTEEADPDPVNDYGRAKVNAENIVRQYVNSAIVRTSLIYGLKIMDHSTAWITAALKKGQTVTLFNNQLRNPVWVQTLSLGCLELVEHSYTGIINIAGSQTMSRAEFGLKLLDWWHVQDRSNLLIGPSTTTQWPLDCRMDIRRAQDILATPLLGVDELLLGAT